jgi:branched-chain amino acid aminotransferase
MEFADMPVIEKNIEPYDVYDADEAFVTGTPFCLLPVVSLNGLLIGDGTVRPIFNCLLAEWSRFVDLDIKRQIQSWDNGAEIGTSVYSFRAN